MAQENSNSTMEMGTSDQVLVNTKRKKKMTLIIGFVAMLVAIAAVVLLVVLLGGGDDAVAQPIGPPEGPTTPDVPITEPTTSTTTAAPEVPTEPEAPTEAPTEAPPATEAPETDPQIELEDVISGAYSPVSFNATWSSGTDVLFRSLTGDLVLYDVVTDSTTPLVQNTSEILQQSSRVTTLSPDGTHVVLSYNVVPVYRYSFHARYSAISVITGEEIDIAPPGVAVAEAYLQNFVWGPDGTSCAFVYFNNVYYKPNLTAEATQITTDGQLNVIYHGVPDWVYEEEVFLSSNAIWFSTDGTKLAYATFDDTSVSVMRVPLYVLPRTQNHQYTQHHEIRYPKPGTTNPTVSVTLVDIEDDTRTVYTAPAELDQPILKTVRFVSNNNVAVMWTNRVQNILIVELCAQASTTCFQIYSYTEANGWIDNIPFVFNEAGTAFLTILPQAVNGTLYKQVVQISEAADGWTSADRTSTSHTVTDILKWTSDDHIWYKATAVNDSAEQHIFVADASNTIACFTCAIRRGDGGECLYNEADISADGTLITVNCAGPSVPQVFIYSTNGTHLRDWETNDEVSALVATRATPVIIRTSVPVADGLPDADVHIQVPADYASRTNVPLLVFVYGAPETALVTKQWSIDWGSSLVNRWGIALAHIDGRGSSLRGVDNMFALNRRLGSVEIDDQINVTRQLHQTFSWLDSNRTCIWGWSYGGYASSLALARGGDVFRCAIAVAPVVDWRYYDTIYTERYMDVPLNNTQGYAESSLLTSEVVEAFRDKRYFLVQGTADDNVHYQHAMLLSRVLQRNDVYFTQMSYTDEDHSLGGVRPHLYHGLEKFLQENML